jgi:putative IMPACT (imprinted ancient) family translation regulator
MAHRTLAAVARHEDVVKGSRFRAVVAPLERPEDAEGWIARVRAAESDAGHVAWAWRWGESLRWSDDGEPGGTAGRPMLGVLTKCDLDRAIALVARVFGGVKLGAGGLARAYGGAVARALDGARIVEVPDRRAFVVQAGFADVDVLLRLLDRPAVDHAPIGFGADGITVRGLVVAEAAEAIAALAVESTRGRAVWRWVSAASADAPSPADQRK